MTTIETSIALSGLLIILVLMGMRVAFATALIGFLGLFVIFAIDKNQGLARGFMTAVKISGQIPHSKTASHVLALIPTFILMAELMNRFPDRKAD